MPPGLRHGRPHTEVAIKHPARCLSISSSFGPLITLRGLDASCCESSRRSTSLSPEVDQQGQPVTIIAGDSCTRLHALESAVISRVSRSRRGCLKSVPPSDHVVMFCSAKAYVKLTSGTTYLSQIAPHHSLPETWSAREILVIHLVQSFSCAVVVQ